MRVNARSMPPENQFPRLIWTRSTWWEDTAVTLLLPSKRGADRACWLQTRGPLHQKGPPQQASSFLPWIGLISPSWRGQEWALRHNPTPSTLLGQRQRQHHACTARRAAYRSGLFLTAATISINWRAALQLLFPLFNSSKITALTTDIICLFVCTYEWGYCWEIPQPDGARHNI